MNKQNTYMNTTAKEYNLNPGEKLRFLSGTDKDKVFTIKSNLKPCTRTEGCYTAELENGMTVYIFPSELIDFGYEIIQ